MELVRMLRKHNFIKMLWTAVVALLLAACSSQDGSLKISPDAISGRWYNQAQVDQGQQIFADNCAACHGTAGQGGENWRVANAEGVYPAPPLNGSAHAWHHPLALLKQTINDGGVALGGSMPAWQDRLTDDQQMATIAALQYTWSDDIYNAWKQINAR
jgi:mono/diheme cytochrome c family protein